MQCGTNLTSLWWCSGCRRRAVSGWQSCRAHAQVEYFPAEVAKLIMLSAKAGAFVTFVAAKTWSLTGKAVARGSRQPGAKQAT
jgi:hypothetical protein